MCATAEIWEVCWHVRRPELHARSRNVSRVTEVCICAIEFNVKSPLTSQLHALTSHELTWREDSVSPAVNCHTFSIQRHGKGEVKVTLVQALRLCTGRTAHRGSRGIALLFHYHGPRKGWGVSVTPRPLFTPGKDPVTIVQEVGWASPGFDPRSIQPVASRYTDFTTRPTRHTWIIPEAVNAVKMLLIMSENIARNI